MIDNFQTQADKALYLLSFIDVIDRIDIFILEIRHLQQSVIYNLHAPSLFLPLRFEEDFILKAKWDTNLWDKTNSVWDAQLASRCVIRYPSPRKAVSTYQQENQPKAQKDSSQPDDDATRFLKIKQHLRLRVGKIWIGDDWARDQRRQYYTLRTLQTLKQQIVRLKFTLVRAAIKADLIGSKGVKRQLEPAAFVILRRGVIVSLRTYVNVFNSHRQQMAQNLDFGLPHDPSPSTDRRRETGLFTDYMSNSGEQIQSDILNLLSCFNFPVDIKKLRPLVFHSWSHSHSVNNFHLFDDVFTLQQERNLLAKSGEYGLEGGQSISYINSSFWFPDRPDLYPIAAREVANSIVSEQLQGLDDVVFSTHSDDFTDLLLHFKTLLSDWSKKNDALTFIEESIPQVLQIFASDLLAATVKGVPYLYAMFLLRLGHHTESQLYANASVNKKISFDMAYLLENGTAPFEKNMLWYFQFHLVATWIEETTHITLSPLDKLVTAGVKDISNQLLAFLDVNTPPKRRHCAKLLTDLKDELEQTMCAHPIIALAKNWRHQRSTDYWDEKKHQRGKGCFSRTAQRLDTRLQNYLYRLLLKQKTGEDRLLRDNNNQPLTGEALEKRFKKIYALPIDTQHISGISQPFRHPNALFRHLYDIPFQCSVMRSIDLIHKDKTSWENSWKYIWTQIHQDMAQGRDLFALALEFHLREVESPREHLMQCINLVTYILRVLKQTPSASNLQQQELAKKLKHWLTEETSLRVEEIRTYLSSQPKFFNLSFSQIQKKCSSGGKQLDISAITLSTEYFGSNSYNTLFIRRLESLSKGKLNELFVIANNYCQENCKSAITSDAQKRSRVCTLLVELRHVLALKNNQLAPKNQTTKDEFYCTMLQAFGDQWKRTAEAKHKTYPPLPNTLKTWLLSRLVMTNIYPILDPKRLEKNPYETNYSKPLDSVISRPYWPKKKQRNENQRKNKEVGYTMLGRYDAIVIRETKWPCRCRVQKIADDGEIKDNDEIERFIPYFSRRETALHLNITSLDSSYYFKKQNVFAIVVVSLQRRPMRLDFLFRLIRDNSNNAYLAGLEACLANRSKEIQIRAYLTDGWGDIALFFSQKTLTVESIDWIHQLKIALFEDVMVERTETLFSPVCLDHVIQHSRYQVSVKIRLLEDRWLSYGSQRFQEMLLHVLTKTFQETGIISTIFSLSDRMDYHIMFQNQSNENIVLNQIIPNFHKRLIQAFALPSTTGQASVIQLIDRIETILEQKITP
jgi:hypothetical protein